MSDEQERHMHAIRLRHRAVKSDLPHDICWTCQTYWPCDVDDLQAQLAKAQAENKWLREGHEGLKAGLALTEAEAERLREALEPIYLWIQYREHAFGSPILDDGVYLRGLHDWLPLAFAVLEGKE